MLNVASGVPQDSVLGPLLFLYYFNYNIIKLIHLFADGCVLFKSMTSPSEKCLLNSSLGAKQDWCDVWSMKLNLEKKKPCFMYHTNNWKHLMFSYSVNDVPIFKVEQAKYLGVTIDKTLSWSDYIISVSSSAVRNLGLVLHKLKNALSNVKLLAYRSLIPPKLEYSSIVWDPFTTKVYGHPRKNSKVRFIHAKFQAHRFPITVNSGQWYAYSGKPT